MQLVPHDQGYRGDRPPVRRAGGAGRQLRRRGLSRLSGAGGRRGRGTGSPKGFPLALKGKSGQALKPKPVNNAREDKLGTAFWRPTEEWGQAYSMVMVDGCAQMADVHDRVPVVLARSDWEQWLAGTPAEALALCQTCSSDLEVERTPERWAARRS